jgi:hypothetical protein
METIPSVQNSRVSYLYLNLSAITTEQTHADNVKERNDMQSWNETDFTSLSKFYRS